MQNKIIEQKYYVCLHAAGPLGGSPVAVRVFMFIGWNECTEYKNKTNRYKQKSKRGAHKREQNEYKLKQITNNPRP